MKNHHANKHVTDRSSAQSPACRLTSITLVIVIVGEVQRIVGPCGINDDGGAGGQGIGQDRIGLNRVRGSDERAVVQDNALCLAIILRIILAATGQEAGSRQPQEQTR